MSYLGKEPWHTLDFTSVNAREKGEEHWAVMDADHGCIAHVFDLPTAKKMAAAPELIAVLLKVRKVNDESGIDSVAEDLNAVGDEIEAALKKAGVL